MSSISVHDVVLHLVLHVNVVMISSVYANTISCVLVFEFRVLME